MGLPVSNKSHVTALQSRPSNSRLSCLTPHQFCRPTRVGFSWPPRERLFRCPPERKRGLQPGRGKFETPAGTGRRASWHDAVFALQDRFARAASWCRCEVVPCKVGGFSAVVLNIDAVSMTLFLASPPPIYSKEQQANRRPYGRR